MKTLYKNAIIIFSAILALSCSHDELIIPDTGKDICIEYDAVLTSFSGYDVSSKQTKAAPSETSPSELDNRIVSAYFMVYGADGERLVSRIATVSDNQIQPETLYHNSGKGPLTICYIANVRESYADSLDNLSKLSDPDYAYKMLYADPSAADDLIGVPLLNGSQCFPMIGIITQSYDESGLLSGVNQDENGKYITTIPLKRLFAKVYVQINWDTQVNTDNLLADQGFNLNFHAITNLPKCVLMAEVEDGSESAWVKDNSSMTAPVIINNSQETGLLTNIEFILYVPEYVLLPEDTEVEKHSGKLDVEKQKVKPTLFDAAKKPMYLTIEGTVRSTDFVDVPLVYTIYLGENAFDSFTLRRNNQYNNIITITGTGDAILGTDTRVEATYHNLADPTNSGTDNPANCYIIGRPGRYLIPTYKGNSSEMLGGIDISKSVKHTDGKNSITNLKYIADPEEGKNWVMFDVNMTIADNAITDLPAVEDGNTVLEFKDASGNTVWSWHLWFTSGGLLGSEWGGISSETYNTNATMMNRNIGAPGAENIGMYYTWGDKDPYFTPSGKSAGYYGGVAAGSWSGGTKQVTDPCPPGYMVPTYNVWNSTTNTGTTFGPNYFTYEANPLVIYPYSSLLDGNGILYIVESVPLTQNGSTTIYTTGRKLGTLFNTTYYVRLVYSGSKSAALGNLWGSNGYLYFSTETHTINDDYTIQYSTDNSSWTTIGNTIKKILNRLGLDDLVTTLLGELKEAKEEYVRYEALQNGILINGYQVRCVSETSTVQ